MTITPQTAIAKARDALANIGEGSMNEARTALAEARDALATCPAIPFNSSAFLESIHGLKEDAARKATDAEEAERNAITVEANTLDTLLTQLEQEHGS